DRTPVKRQSQGKMMENEFQDGFNKDLSQMLDKMEEMDMTNNPDDPIFASSTPDNPVAATVSVAPKKKKPDPPQQSLKKSAVNLSVLSDSMVVNGSITVEDALAIRGTVYGDVEVKGKLSITGTVEGEVKASEVYLEGAQITGNILSKGGIKVGPKTVILGNINAENAVINGAVKGEIDVHGTVVLESAAIIIGDIKSKFVQVSNGAVIEGKCSQCYAEISPTTIFDEIKNKR
ncbi:MAG: polymer-forming cytoskeletal protein, partial [Lachnospiraceae bacterium]|nr:polymer-forming cytoskeletal protein [Lachnospiraceae bacterium]